MHTTPVFVAPGPALGDHGKDHSDAAKEEATEGRAAKGGERGIHRFRLFISAREGVEGCH